MALIPGRSGSPSRWRIACGSVVFACACLLLVPWVSQPTDRLFSCLHDLAHFPLFFAITACLIVLIPFSPSRWFARATAVWALSLGLGLLVELIQPLIGREQGVADFLIGAVGSSAAAAVFAARCATGRPARAALAGAAILLGALSMLPSALVFTDRLVAQRQFPLLSSFECSLETGRWSANHSEIWRTSEHATDGRRALGVRVLEQAEYPGVFLVDSPEDWTALRRVCLDVWLAGTRDHAAWLRMDDRLDPPYADRFQKSMTLRPGTNRLCVVRDELTAPDGRGIDLRHVRSFGLFLESGSPGDEVTIDNVRIETD